MLGAIGDGTGFSADEIEGFDFSRVLFWWNCLMAWREHAAKISES